MKYRLLTITIILSFAAHPASATRTVTSPTVTAGETVGEIKGEYVVDENDSRDGAWKNKLTLGHGFTSYWYSEIETNIDQSGNPDDRTDFTSIDWKNKFQFTSQKDAVLDSGIRLTYGKNLSGDQDKVEFKFLAGKDIGQTAHRLNLILDRGVSEGKGVNGGLSWSSRFKYTDLFQPGFELYDSFGKLGQGQSFDSGDHRIGPVFYGKLTPKLSYDAGYLFGISDAAPDGTAKIILKYKLN